MRPTSYPLSWPPDRARTPADDRRLPRFGTKSAGNLHTNARRSLTVAQGISRVYDELAKLDAVDVTISTNISQMRRDGYPRSDVREPDDCGAAVWFSVAGAQRVLACDRWNTVGGNLGAIAAHLNALRGMDRWGVGTVAQAFEGHRALPAAKSWWEVLGVEELATVREIDEAFRRLATTEHPDAGGSDTSMAILNNARAAGRKARLG